MARGSSQYFSSGSARSEISNRVIADVKSPIKGLGKLIRSKSADRVSSELVSKNLQESERTIVSQSNEYATIYKDGVQIMIKTSGKPDAVDFTAKELKALKGATFTHNHPMVDGQDIPFSRADLGFARNAQLEEIRAVSGNTVFSIKPSPEFFKIPKGKFNEILNGFRDEQIKRLGFNPKTFNEKSDVADKVRVLDATFTEFDKFYKINYTKSTL
jgi:hypothetical protein